MKIESFDKVPEELDKQKEYIANLKDVIAKIVPEATEYLKESGRGGYSEDQSNAAASLAISPELREFYLKDDGAPVFWPGTLAEFNKISEKAKGDRLGIRILELESAASTILGQLAKLYTIQKESKWLGFKVSPVSMYFQEPMEIVSWAMNDFPTSAPIPSEYRIPTDLDWKKLADCCSWSEIVGTDFKCALIAIGFSGNTILFNPEPESYYKYIDSDTMTPGWLSITYLNKSRTILFHKYATHIFQADRCKIRLIRTDPSV